MKMVCVGDSGGCGALLSTCPTLELAYARTYRNLFLFKLNNAMLACSKITCDCMTFNGADNIGKLEVWMQNIKDASVKFSWNNEHHE